MPEPGPNTAGLSHVRASGGDMNLVVTIGELTIEARDLHPVERTDVAALLVDLAPRLHRELQRADDGA